MLQPINLNVTSAKTYSDTIASIAVRRIKVCFDIYPLEAAAAKRGLNLIKNSLQLNGPPQTIRRFCPVCGHLVNWNRKEENGLGSEIAVYCNACRAQFHVARTDGGVLENLYPLHSSSGSCN